MSRLFYKEFFKAVANIAGDEALRAGTRHIIENGAPIVANYIHSFFQPPPKKPESKNPDLTPKELESKNPSPK